MGDSNRRPKNLNGALVQSMPDLRETLPDVDNYFRYLEKAAKECEEREKGGCSGCDTARMKLCQALWDEICELSVQDKLCWAHITDKHVRDTVNKFLKVTRGEPL